MKIISTPQFLTTGLGALLLGGALWWQRSSARKSTVASPSHRGATSLLDKKSQQMSDTTSEETLASADDIFLEKVRNAIKVGMSSNEFNVALLAEQVGMTRVHLYRRLRNLVAQSPSELIRHLRLERAEKLLRARVGSVSQIAYRVGFKSASHFSQSFRDRYQQLPSTYRNTAPPGTPGRQPG